MKRYVVLFIFSLNTLFASDNAGSTVNDLFASDNPGSTVNDFKVICHQYLNELQSEKKKNLEKNVVINDLQTELIRLKAERDILQNRLKNVPSVEQCMNTMSKLLKSEQNPSHLDNSQKFQSFENTIINLNNLLKTKDIELARQKEQLAGQKEQLAGQKEQLAGQKEQLQSMFEKVAAFIQSKNNNSNNNNEETTALMTVIQKAYPFKPDLNKSNDQLKQLTAKKNDLNQTTRHINSFHERKCAQLEREMKANQELLAIKDEEICLHLKHLSEMDRINNKKKCTQAVQTNSSSAISSSVNNDANTIIINSLQQNLCTLKAQKEALEKELNNLRAAQEATTASHHNTIATTENGIQPTVLFQDNNTQTELNGQQLEEYKTKLNNLNKELMELNQQAQNNDIEKKNEITELQKTYDAKLEELNKQLEKVNSEFNSANLIAQQKQELARKFEQKANDQSKEQKSCDLQLSQQRQQLKRYFLFGLPAAFCLGILAPKYGTPLLQKTALTAFTLGKTSMQAGRSWLGNLPGMFNIFRR